jgi:hypothetical protein
MSQNEGIGHIKFLVKGLMIHYATTLLKKDDVDSKQSKTSTVRGNAKLGNKGSLKNAKSSIQKVIETN